MMDRLELHVHLAGDVPGFRELVEGAKPLAGLSVEVLELEDDALFPDRHDALVVSGDAARIARVLEGKTFANGVFCGDTGEALEAFGGELPGCLKEIWPAEEPAAVRAWRVERLLEAAKSSFDAWLYKTWLYALIDALPDLIWFKDNDGLHNWVNEAFCKTVGKTREDCKDKHHNYIWNVPPEDWEKGAVTCMESEEKVVAARKMLMFEEQVSTDEGMKHLTVYKAPVFDPYGEIVGTVGLGHDVTDFSNMGRELTLLMESMPFPLVLLDHNRVPARFNKLCATEFGIDVAAPASFDYSAWKHATFTELREVKRGEGENAVRVQEMSAVLDGEERFFHVTEQALYDVFGSVSGYYCMFNDVTAQRRYEDTLTELANTDVLTQVRNRRYFYSYLLDHSGSPITLLYMDLDNFKPVNDRYGHAKGDEVLVTAARSIRDAFPQGLVARLGGDEFAVALEGALGQDELAQRVADFKAAFGELLGEYGVTVSVGSAIADEGIEDVDELLLTCDKRMYEDKAVRR